MIWRAGLDAKCDYFNETWLAVHRAHARAGDGRRLGRGRAPGRFRALRRSTTSTISTGASRSRWSTGCAAMMACTAGSSTAACLSPTTPARSRASSAAASTCDERRRAQDEQQQHSQEQLALARDFEKWILAIVSHDIRDPLGTIQLAAHALADRIRRRRAGAEAAPSDRARRDSASSTSSATCSTSRASARARHLGRAASRPTCARCASRSSTSSKRIARDRADHLRLRCRRPRRLGRASHPAGDLEPHVQCRAARHAGLARARSPHRRSATRGGRSAQRGRDPRGLAAAHLRALPLRAPSRQPRRGARTRAVHRERDRARAWRRRSKWIRRTGETMFRLVLPRTASRESPVTA